MTGYLMRSGRSRVFRAISWAFDMKIQPEDLLCGNFFILDIDPRPELAFLRDGRYRFRA